MRRVETRYLDLVAPDLDTALREVEEAKAAGEGRSIGLVMTANELHSALRARGVVPDIVTDQTAAHDPLVGYVPDDLSLEQAAELRESDPQAYIERARAAMARQVAMMVEWQELGATVVDYGNNLRTEAKTAGYARAFDYPGFVPAYVRPLFCRGIGPFRWAALSGNPDDIAATDAADARAVSRERQAAALARRRAASGSRSRASPRASAGSATATGTAPACGSTSWCARAR